MFRDDHRNRLLCNMTFFRLGHYLDLRSNFQNYVLRSKYSWFDVTQKEIACVLIESKVITGFFFRKKQLFLEFLLSGGQTNDLRLNMRTYRRKSVKRAINCSFQGRCNSSGSGNMCRFVEKKNVEKGKTWPLPTSGDLAFGLTKTLTEVLPP